MRIRLRVLSVCLALAAGAVGASGAAAVAAEHSGGDAPKPPSSDDCLGCHSDPSIAREDGTVVAVDSEAYSSSIHGPMDCVDCHADLASLTEFPHASRLERVDCGICHGDAQEAYGKSVHAQARANGHMLAANCTDCHGMHDIRPSSDPRSRTYHLNLPRTCSACHGNADIIKRGEIEIGDVASGYHDSIHGKALEKSGLVVAPSCVDCHGAHEIARKDDPASPVFQARIPATCGKCHEGVLRLYDAGIHAAALASGNPQAPACTGCHTAHTIQRADSDAWRLSVTAECGSCHAGVVESFRRTFHGKVTELGFGRVAACADCHGAHDILPGSDPESTVSPARLEETCGRCHPGANESFVQYDPHPNPADYDRGPLLWWVNRFYVVLISGCFGLFGLHSALWFYRSSRERAGGGPPGPPDDEKEPRP